MPVALLQWGVGKLCGAANRNAVVVLCESQLACGQLCACNGSTAAVAAAAALCRRGGYVTCV